MRPGRVPDQAHGALHRERGVAGPGACPAGLKQHLTPDDARAQYTQMLRMGKSRLQAHSGASRGVMACAQAARNSRGSPATRNEIQRTVPDWAIFSGVRHVRFNELVAHARFNDAIKATDGRHTACRSLGSGPSSWPPAMLVSSVVLSRRSVSRWSTSLLASFVVVSTCFFIVISSEYENVSSTQDCSAGRERDFHGAWLGSLIRCMGEEHGATSRNARYRAASSRRSRDS